MSRWCALLRVRRTLLSTCLLLKLTASIIATTADSPMASAIQHNYRAMLVQALSEPLTYLQAGESSLVQDARHKAKDRRRDYPPEVPSQFWSSAILTITGFSLPSKFFYDSQLRRTAYSYTIEVPYAPIMDWWTYSSDDVMFLYGEGVCRPIPGSNWTDLFSWVKHSRAAGEVVVDGRSCSLWNLTTADASLSLCANGNTPVYLQLGPRNPTPASSLSGQAFEAVFGDDFTPGLPDDSVFQPPDTCFEPLTLLDTHVCENGTTTVLDAFIFHTEDHFNVSGQNVADLLGDVLFFCNDILTKHTSVDQYSLISRYAVEVYTGWGQYQICNGYPPLCFGLNDQYVGREASFGAKGDRGGQCTDNSDTGSWFSLPIAGQCTRLEQPLGPGGCTWRVLKRVKTIDAACLFDDQHAIAQSCLAELPTGAVHQTLKIFQTAFETDDPTEGGCPAL